MQKAHVSLRLPQHSPLDPREVLNDPHDAVPDLLTPTWCVTTLPGERVTYTLLNTSLSHTALLRSQEALPPTAVVH